MRSLIPKALEWIASLEPGEEDEEIPEAVYNKVRAEIDGCDPLVSVR